ncbi:MAG: hypothetical protein KDA89_22350, partial [Planctomycetaceae bacterium]|nr:hypothetical protein [Planctomycetaceae bacterium]
LDRLLPATLAAGLLFSIHRLGLTMLRKPRRCTAGVDEPEQAPTSDGAVRSAAADDSQTSQTKTTQDGQTGTTSAGSPQKALRRSTGDRVKICLIYLLLTAGSVIWIRCLQQTPPRQHREIKPLWVLYDPSSSGYFFEAAFRMTSVRRFLAGYEERMGQGDVLHVGTHPPGLFLLSRLCLDLCEHAPGLASAVQVTVSPHAVRAFRTVEAEARLAPALSATQLAALQLLSLFMELAISLTILPLAFVGGYCFDRRTVWQICCLWPTLPALSIFCPKSDVLFPLTGMLVIAGTVASLQQPRRWWSAVVSGIVLWCGLMLSLAHLPVLVLLLIFAAAEFLVTERPRSTHLLWIIGVLITTVAVCTVLFSITMNCNLGRVWLLNLTNHAGFYEQYPRTAWKWLLANIPELAFAVGLPMFTAAVVSVTAQMRTYCRSALTTSAATEVPADAAFLPERTHGGSSADNRMTTAIFCTAAGFTMLSLWLSGKNHGEAARLWCFLMPWIALCTGPVIRQSIQNSGNKPFASGPARVRSVDVARVLSACLLLQLVVSVLTVSRVSGFSF